MEKQMHGETKRHGEMEHGDTVALCLWGARNAVAQEDHPCATVSPCLRVFYVCMFSLNSLPHLWRLCVKTLRLPNMLYGRSMIPGA